MFLATSHVVATKATYAILSVITSVNQTLDVLTRENSAQVLRHRHKSVAQAVNIVQDLPIDSKLAAQNNLSRSIVIAYLHLVKYLLTAHKCSPAVVDVNENTLYFGRL